MKKFNKSANRWNYYERRYDSELNKNLYGLTGDVHNFGIADINYKSPKPVVDAIITRAKKGTYSYSYTPDKTFNVIKDWYWTERNINIKQEWIKIVHGTINAMYQMVQAFTQENDYVLIQTPLYKPFAEAIEFNNRKIANNKLIYDKKLATYLIDFEDFEQQIIQKEIKLFMLCSPHNPGSRVWTLNEMNKMVEICQKHNVLIFSDEVHSDIVFTQFTSILEFDYKNTIIANSPNKAFNLGGLKASYLIIPNNELMQKIIWQYKKNALTSANMWVNVAFQNALGTLESKEWLKQLTDYIAQNYKYFKQEVKKLGWEVFDLQSTYLVWIKLPFRSDGLVNYLKTQKIIICDYHDFYNAEDTYIRINIATNKEELRFLIDKFKSFKVKN